MYKENVALYITYTWVLNAIDSNTNALIIIITSYYVQGI